MSPNKTKSPCRHKGCHNFTAEPYCPEHTSTEAPVLPYYNTTSKIYSTARWKKLRRMVLRRNPICAVIDCANPATQVDHVTPLADGGEPFSSNNLQALCIKCHSRKTLEEARNKSYGNKKNGSSSAKGSTKVV